MHLKTLLCLGILALAATACGGHKVADPLPRNASEWIEFTPAPTEIDGQLFTPTCSSAPGADPAFRFWARRGSTNRLVVYFDGGGACWDDETCSHPRLEGTPRDAETYYKAELMSQDTPNTMEGLFNLSDSRNPVRDWSFVFVPYCTADVHSGSNSTTYTNPETHETLTINHRGADNFRVVLEWMRANFSAPSEIFVTGSSAGAYGAVTNFAHIRDAFPEGRAVMLGDAGQGVTTAGFLEERNSNWHYQLPESVFGENATLTDDEDIVARLAAHYPEDRFAQYTTAHDRVQVGFYALMGASQPCASWTETMSRDLTQREAAPNFRAYLAAGDTHTILRSPLFYMEASGGAPFAQWLALMLGDGGAGWADQNCADCLTPPSECEF